MSVPQTVKVKHHSTAHHTTHASATSHTADANLQMQSLPVQFTSSIHLILFASALLPVSIDLHAPAKCRFGTLQLHQESMTWTLQHCKSRLSHSQG